VEIRPVFGNIITAYTRRKSSPLGPCRGDGCRTSGAGANRINFSNNAGTIYIYIYTIMCTEGTGKVTQQEIQNTNSYTHTHIHTTSQYTVRTCNTSPDTWGVRIRVLGRRSDTPRLRCIRRARRENQLASDTATILLLGAFYGVIAIIILPSSSALSPT
jgi:hypothetical protein